MNTVKTKALDINLDQHVSKCYLAYPLSERGADPGEQKNRPGILVVPEFWGLTEHVKNRADRLAKLGYCALAVDVYGEGWVGDTAQAAADRMKNLYADMDKVSKQMKGYLKALKNLEQTDPAKTASIGYCLGGALSLHLARMGEEVTGVASFHGALQPRGGLSIQPGDVKAKVLVCHGGADTMISDEQVQNFKKEMETAEVDYQWFVYPDAQHGFTNPKATENGKKFNIPTAYSEEADKASWAELLKFFERIFA